MDKISSFFVARKTKIFLSIALLVVVCIYFSYQAIMIVGQKKPMWYTEKVSEEEKIAVSAVLFANETVIDSESVILTDTENGERISAGYTLGKNASGEIISPASGYFYNFADGREGVFTVESAESLTVSKYLFLMSSPDKYGHSAKILTDFYIYLVIYGNSDLSKRTDVGAAYTAYTTDGKEKFTVEAISTECSSDGYLAVFKCDDFPMKYIDSRSIRFDLVIEKHEGISVPKDAVYSYGEYNKVFVYESGYARSRDIEILYESDEFYIVSGDLSECELIIREKGLYNGKVMK